MAKKKKPSRKSPTPKRKKTTAKPKPRSKAKAKSRTRTRRAPKRAPGKSSAKKTARPKGARPRKSRVVPVARRISMRRGLGAEAGGQSGDTEGLSRAQSADSESVEELVEEGQAFEAGIIDGVENSPDPGRGGIRTREVPEDDVPQEYLDED